MSKYKTVYEGGINYIYDTDNGEYYQLDETVELLNGLSSDLLKAYPKCCKCNIGLSSTLHCTPCHKKLNERGGV